MNLPIVLALSFAVPAPVAALGPVHRANLALEAPAPAADSSIAAKVEVEVTGFEDRADEAESLKNRAITAISSEGVTEPKAEDDPRVYLKITVLGEFGDEGYNIAFDAFGNQGSLFDTPIDANCELCTEGELTDKITEEFRKLKPQLIDYVKSRDEAKANPGGQGTPSGSGGDDTLVPPPDGSGQTPGDGTGQTPGNGNGQTPGTNDQPKGMSTMGKAGIGLMVGGGIGVAVGVGLALNPDKPASELIGYELVSTRTPGIATLAVGGAVLITGAVLFVLDRRKQRERTTAVAPILGPNVAGVGVAGRF